MILKGTVTFQVHVTTELGPILETMPHPRHGQTKHCSLFCLYFLLFPGVRNFLAPTSMMYHHYDAIRRETWKKRDVKEITRTEMKKSIM